MNIGMRDHRAGIYQYHSNFKVSLLAVGTRESTYVDSPNPEGVSPGINKLLIHEPCTAVHDK